MACISTAVSEQEGAFDASGESKGVEDLLVEIGLELQHLLLTTCSCSNTL